MDEIGKLTKSIVTKIPCDIGSEEYKFYYNTVPFFEGDAIYIYSFKKKRMVFARGWEPVLGYKDDEITMLTIVSITTKKYYNFSNELNDKALLFISTVKEDLEKYSFTLEVEKKHVNGSVVPLFSKVGVFKSNNGQIEEIIGVSRVIDNFRQSKVMKYAAYGPKKSNFEDMVSKDLFNHQAISSKELEALKLASKGYTYKEIADLLDVSNSAIQKRLLPMFKRFNVKSLPHLISFAYENHII